MYVWVVFSSRQSSAKHRSHLFGNGNVTDADDNRCESMASVIKRCKLRCVPERHIYPFAGVCS